MRAQAVLQEGLEERGLPKSGTKPVLARRLADALAEERALAASEEPSEARAELERQFREAAMLGAALARSRHGSCLGCY
jgi:hypothetical protein